MVPFAGWLMPVQYTSILEEHQAVRNNVGIFDISHMGQFIVDGANARDWLNRMLTNNVDKLDVGVGQYTFLLNERGGIIDDLIAYRIDEEKYLLVVNAARADEDFAWLQNHLKEGRSPDRPSGGSSFAEATAGKLETAAPCGDPICKMASLVELVCSSTTILRPMKAEGRAACSWLAISRSNFSTVNMSHFQPEIDRAC